MGKDLKGKELGKGFSQRKDGRYEARAMVNGVKVDLYDTSLSQLKKRFEMEKAKVLRDEKNIRPNLKFGDWFEEWFEKYKAQQLKDDVCRHIYKRKVKNTYVKILGGKRIEEISNLNIQDATNELVQQGYVERTIKEALSGVGQCMDSAVVNHILRVNPCVNIVVKDSSVRKERRVLSLEEQKLFLKEAEKSYYYEAYQILLCTGMRIGEFSGLWWSDVDFENKCIHINRSLTSAYFNGRKVLELSTPKTSNSYRTIPFFNDTEQYFLAWKKKQEFYRGKLGPRWRTNPELGDLVFTSTMGSPVTRYVIAHDLARIERDLNLKEVSLAARESREPKVFEHLHPHAFRHTFATRCFEKGLLPEVVQSIMGHSSYETTLSYTHIMEDIMRKEVGKAGDFL